MQIKEYDIVIVGAGIVALTFAALLQDSNLKIAIIDRVKFKSSNHYAAPRVSAINKSSEEIFNNLNIWQNLDNNRITPYRKITVSESDNEINFKSNDYFLPNLGHIIENENIQQALYKILKTSHIDFLIPKNIVNLSRLTDKTNITFDDGKTISTKLLVGADGANSYVRQSFNIATTGHDYNQSAMVANLRLNKSHHNCARQIFFPNGPFAILPLFEQNLVSVVISQPPHVINTLCQLSESDFLANINEYWQDKFKFVELISPRFTFPLAFKCAKQYVQTGLALIGDAAHSIHPLAGLGLNVGIKDAFILSNTIKHSLQRKNNFAKLHNLRAYERHAKANNLKIFTFVNTIQKYFSIPKNPIRIMGSMALSLVDNTKFCKKLFASAALKL